MAIPDFQTLMLPLLQFAADGKQHSMQEAREHLAKEFKLTAEEQAELLPSGRVARFTNRVAWARVYLGQAGLLESPKRGTFVISERGQAVLREKPPRIDIKYLERFSEFQEFRQTSREKADDSASEVKQRPETPEEALEQAYQDLRNETANQLLTLIKRNSPEFFEKLVVHLLVKMGYGGSLKDAGEATRMTADEGIDGIIKEDRLGLDTIYVQAKRWEAPVDRPEIHKFVGALHGQRAKKGVFITTSRFSSGAIEYVKQIDPKVVLIDGNLLVQLMIDHNVGVAPSVAYEVKKIDMDFFSED